jgi:hypothetical protein
VIIITSWTFQAFGITHGHGRSRHELANPGFLLERIELVGIQDQSHGIANPKGIQDLDILEAVISKPIC